MRARGGARAEQLRSSEPGTWRRERGLGDGRAALARGRAARDGESPLATPRYELVDGELLVTPSPNWPHQRAIAIRVRELGQYLTAEPVGHLGLSILWHRVAAEKQFRLDLQRYFAEVFG